MSHEPSHSTDRDRRVDEILGAYLEAVAAGTAPERQVLLAEHPELSSELLAFFADHDALKQIARPGNPEAELPARQGSACGAPTLAHGESGPIASPLGTIRYFGDYELLEEIARGGMGVVYKARQAKLNRIVAVKMILAGQLASATDVQRFHAEAEAAANLKHAHIVAIHEVGEHNGQHYFSMDFIDGVSLAALVRENPLPASRAAAYVEKVATAIHYAHQRGTVHRDLKPSNILIDGNDEPLVTDFGLAMRLTGGSDLTGTGQVLGTPSYMPPEQAAGNRGDVGPLSDVYSLGAILYELLAGRPPFRAETPLDTVLQVLEAEPASPRLLNPKVPKDLETICLKCLHKDPRRRYATASALAEDLRRFRHDEPIHARPVGAIEKALRWTRKQRRSAVVATVAAAAAALIVIVGVIGWNLHEQSRLGSLSLQTDGPPLVAEVLDADDQLVIKPFRLPTVEPVELPAGEYRVRLSGSDILSEDFQLAIEAGTKHEFNVNLGERQLWEPLPIQQGELLEAVDLAGRADIVSWELTDQGVSLRRLDGATAKPLWRKTLEKGKLPQVLIAAKDQANWSWEQWWRLLGCDGNLQLIKPASDLDGDGTRDLVWANGGSSRGSWLLAVSGKSGELLWLYHTSRQGCRVLGQAAVADVNGDGIHDLVVTWLAGEQAAIEAISGKDGHLLWKYDLDHRWLNGTDKKPRQAAEIVKAGGKSLVAMVVGKHLIGLDPATGKPAWPAHDLAFLLRRPAQFVDLDGDAHADLLILHSDPAFPTLPVNARDAHDKPVEKLLLTAVSLKSLTTMWKSSVTALEPQAEPEPSPFAITPANWPYVLDLDGDGKLDVVVESITPSTKIEKDAFTGWVGVEVLDGATGQPRWSRRLFDRSPWWNWIGREDLRIKGILAAPDLDGDGHNEVIVASLAMLKGDLAPLVFNSTEKTNRFLFVDVLSGKDGHGVSSWKKPVAGSLADLRSLALWQGGADGWPELLVSTRHTPPNHGYYMYHGLDVVSLATGRLSHSVSLPKEWRGEHQCRLADFNGDGILDLYYTRKTTFSTSRWFAIKGSLPEAWRRLGKPEPAGDYDNDGHLDFCDAEPGRWAEPIKIVSGRDGRTLKKVAVDWDAKMGSRKEFRHFLRLPFGDLDGDHVPDILVTEDSTLWGSRGYVGPESPTNWPNPIQAISGATGRKLWEAKPIPMSSLGKMPQNHLTPFDPIVHDLDKDGRVQVVVPFALHGFDRGGVAVHFGVVAVSGSDGALRWRQDLGAVSKRPLGGYVEAGIGLRAATELSDLNKDGHRDLIFSVPMTDEKGEPACEIVTVSGGDGAVLWRHRLARLVSEIGGPWREELPLPVVGDLDGDGWPEVLVVDGASAPVGQAGTAYTLLVLDGRSGKPKWTWQWRSDFATYGPPLTPTPILASLSGNGRLHACLPIQKGNDWQLVLLNHAGAVSVIPLGSAEPTLLRGQDLDGDGKDELLITRGGRLYATKLPQSGQGEPRQVVFWSWQLSSAPVELLDIQTAERGLPVYVVVASGESIFALDGRTGKPAWRGLRDPGSPCKAPLLRATENGELPRLASRSSDATVSRLLLRTDPEGKCLPPSGESVVER